MSADLYIQTAFGNRYSLLYPDPDQILLREVAHALSNICRFTGHTREFYSVAQHSVLIARIMRDEGRDPMTVRAALMHDAHEAFVGDVPTPLKAALRARGPGFDHMETLAKKAISKRFRTPVQLPLAVRQADLRMLMTESAQLLFGGPMGKGWPDAEPYPIQITPWIPDRARLAFLEEAHRCDIS